MHTLMVVGKLCLEETLMVVAKTSFNMCKLANVSVGTKLNLYNIFKILMITKY